MSGKELQRQLGVTYKTAYRIGMQIRKLTESTENFDALLSGHVEIDEAYIGARSKARSTSTIGAPLCFI